VALDGDTDKEIRRDELRKYREGERQFLVSCALFLEGFDAPHTQAIAMARPTLSRALYSQAVGRATRPFAGCVDGLATAEERCAAIKATGKTCLVIDFVGNSGKHKLICTADILGGKYDDDVVARAAAKRDGDNPLPMMELLDKTADEIHEERKAAARKRLAVSAKYSKTRVDPFDLFDVNPGRCPGWHVGRTASGKQLEALRKFKVAEAKLADMNFWEAHKMLDVLIGRSKKGLCTLKQAELLQRFGYDTEATFAEASRLIDGVAKNNWRRP
jgi:superfamily II DNA or RNA helicase